MATHQKVRLLPPHTLVLDGGERAACRRARASSPCCAPCARSSARTVRPTRCADPLHARAAMFALLFDLEDYATTYRATRDAYLKAANELKLACRDGIVT